MKVQGFTFENRLGAGLV